MSAPPRFAWIALASATMFGAVVSAQTAIDQTQIKNIDFANKPYTRPNKTGAALPASCKQGETYFLTTASAGRNLYVCSSDNSWSQVSAGGGGIGSLNGQTGAAQTFQNDSNVTVTSTADVHALGWQGTLPVARGGTGAAAPASARVNLLPSYAGNTGKCLAVNNTGTDILWTACGTGGGAYTAGAGIDITNNIVSLSSAAAQQLFASASLDFPTIPQAACSDLTISLPGASAGDTIAPGWPPAWPSGITGSMFVAVANTVTVRVCNLSGVMVDLPVLSYTARAIRSF